MSVTEKQSSQEPDARNLVAAIAGGEAVPPPEATPPTYAVRGMWEIANLDLPPLTYVWNGIPLEPLAVVEIIGAPGIGKSRVVADLARHQILGRDFGGRKTSQTPLRWLFAGTENGIHRLNEEAARFLFRRHPSELRGMAESERLALAAENGITEADARLLDANFRTFTLENPEDFDISLADETNVARLVETLKAEKPDILAIDPWGDSIAGDELNDGDVRATVRVMRKCLTAAELKKTLLVVVNHARMGVREEANARGLGAGNFGKNSKCLYGIARYVINVRRASLADNPDIELICAKNSNGRQMPPLALRLDAESMSYGLVPDFDHDAWQETLEQLARDEKKAKRDAATADRAATEAATQEAYEAAALKVVGDAGDELLSIANFNLDVAREKGASVGKGKADELRKALVSRGILATCAQRCVNKKGEVVKKQHGDTYISTPSRISAYRVKWGLSPE